MGFGTGLNALLTILEDPTRKIIYTSIEAFRLDAETALLLNYTDLSPLYKTLHEAEWEKDVLITEYFTLHKINRNIENCFFENKYDLVYFDAFSPRVQPELWTTDIFKNIYEAMNEGGILVTYCSKGDVRRNLIAAGFTVEKIPGPPGKREMLRGVRS
jgi:tRNA U34 5-methylaminomethyl-2-thiouridine-forming methyltransferase MnmC